MFQPTRGNRSRYVLALLVATAVTLLTLDFRGFGPLSSGQRSARELLEPIAGAGSSAVRPVKNAWHGVTDYSSVKAENDLLRMQVDELRAQSVGEANAQEMLETILAQNRIETPSGVQKILSRVVAGPVSNFENTIRIDKGTDDGVQAGMPVVSAAGLVGRISEVTKTRSVVELVDSRGFGVSVRLVGSSVPITFLARGQGPAKPLILQGDLPAGVPLADGDTLVTSGLDQSVYPPEILVGRITGTGRTRPPPEPVTTTTTTTTALPNATATATATSASTSLPNAVSTAATLLPPLQTPKAKPLENAKVELFVQPRSLAFVTVLLWKPAP